VQYLNFIDFPRIHFKTSAVSRCNMTYYSKVLSIQTQLLDTRWPDNWCSPDASLGNFVF